MKTNKILLNVSDINNIEEYKKLGVTNFLFPLEGYSIGYNSFSFETIGNTKERAYVLVNRLLTDDDIDAFLKLHIPSNVVGFLIEDVGLYYELKGKGYELYNFQNHLNNNYKTINYWLKYYDSLVVSTDITKSEIEEIINNATKPLIINTLGYPMIMYSRRKLVSNYYKHYNLDTKYSIDIKEPNSPIDFKLVESEYGTAVFDNHLLDGREEALTFNEDKVLFYLINTAFLSDEEVRSALEGKPIENAKKGFLYDKTVYRIGDLK